MADKMCACAHVGRGGGGACACCSCRGTQSGYLLVTLSASTTPTKFNHGYPKTPTMIIYSAIVLLRLRHCLLKRNPHLENSQHDKISIHTRRIKGFSRRTPRNSRDDQDLLYSMEESPEEVGETHPRSLESTTVLVAPTSPPTGFHSILL